MPCNLAISITKAAVTHEHLCRLLTPPVLATAIEALLTDAYASYHSTIRCTPIGVTCVVGPVTFAVVRGTISVRAGARTALAQQLLPDLEHVVRRAADALFLHHVQHVLSAYGAVAHQAMEIDDGGTVLQATVVTVSLYDAGALDVRVVVLPEGKLQIFIDGDVNFETARAVTLQILAQLQAQGVAVQLRGDVEQHKECVSHVHMLRVLEQYHDHA